MRKQIVRKLIAPALLFVMTLMLALVGVMYLLPASNNFAEAATPSTIEFTANPSEVLAGSTFNLQIKLTTTLSTKGWSSASLYIGPLNETGAYDLNVSKYLSYADDASFVGDDADDFSGAYNLTSNGSVLATEGNMNVGPSAKSPKTYLTSATKPMIINVPITISDKITSEGGITEFSLGIRATSKNMVTYSVAGNAAEEVSHTAVPTKGEITHNRANVTIKVPSSDTSFAALKGGPSGGDLKEIDTSDPNNMKFVIDGGYLDDFVILPEPTEDGSTVKINGVEVTNGEEYKPVPQVTVGGTVSIEVTAEDGTKKTYTLKIESSYAALQSLVVTTPTTTAGVTKNGLATEFDPETKNYTVYYPSDGQLSEIVPTVMSGYGIKEDLGSNTTGCMVGTLKSGISKQVYSRTDGCTVEIIVTAHDGVTTASYTLTFEEVDVQTGLDGANSVKAVGVDSNTVYETDANRAAENDVDFFFILLNENDPPKATFNLSFTKEGTTAKINGTDYDSTTQYGADTYTLTVIAEAGNIETYQITLSGPIALELLLTSKYQFLLEEEIEEYEEMMYYRRTYAEKGWKHGVDDKDLERIVLGQISPDTSVNAFFENFDESQYALIRLYNGSGDLVYDRGTVTPDFAEYADESDMLSVGTGWRIDFGAGETPIETIYLSVFGDLNGDGYLATNDSVAILSCYAGLITYDNVEFRLAGYVTNAGFMSPRDAVRILTIYAGLGSVEEHFYNPENAE